MTTIGELTGWRRPRRGHDGKRCFPSSDAAEGAIWGLMRKGYRPTGQAFDGEGLAPYRCREDFATCGEHWHIGHDRRPK